MKTLKQLMAEYPILTDIEIIKQYFIDNNMETQAIDLMRELSVERLRKVEHENAVIKGNVLMFIPTHQTTTWSKQLQSAVERATLYTMIHEELPESLLQYLAQEIPKYELPKLFYLDLYTKLKEKGIYFKGDEKDNL